MKHKNNNERHPPEFNTETVLNKRKINASEDSGSAWLITFADLMTILLVFTFVLFINNMNNDQKNRKTANNKSAENSSLITLAHADMTNTGSETTIYLPNQNSTERKPAFKNPERIILKKHLHFTNNSPVLRQNHLTDLKNFATLLKTNADSKLIISLNEQNSKTLMDHAVNIMTHLSRQQGIAKNNIYIQTVSRIDIPDKYAGQLPENIIALKLVKSFWNL